MIAESDARRLQSPRPRVRFGEWLVALAFLGAINVEIWAAVDLPWSVSHQITATIVAPWLAGSIVFRSTRPLIGFSTNTVATFMMIALGYASGIYQWVNLLLLFSVSVAYRGWRSTLALVAGLAGVSFYFFELEHDKPALGGMVVALWLVGWLVGRTQGAKQLELRLRSDRDLAAELAATRASRLELETQRTTMARELHDLIGHTVNVMVVHAGAGKRAVLSDPAGAQQAFETIATTGRTALAELDRVLGILRDDDPHAPLAPLPGMAALPGLFEKFRGAGLDVSMSTTGPIDALAPGVGLTIYRILQEALTNSMKHGQATRSTITVSIDDEAIHVLAIDNGIGAITSGTVISRTVVNSTATNDTATNGRGLAGISERVQLHGGTATFGPHDGAGYRVECIIPLSTLETA